MPYSGPNTPTAVTPVVDHAQEAYNQLQDMVDAGDLVSWIEEKDGQRFITWRLNPARYPNECYPARIDGLVGGESKGANTGDSPSTPASSPANPRVARQRQSDGRDDAGRS